MSRKSSDLWLWNLPPPPPPGKQLRTGPTGCWAWGWPSWGPGRRLLLFPRASGPPRLPVTSGMPPCSTHMHIAHSTHTHIMYTYMDMQSHYICTRVHMDMHTHQAYTPTRAHTYTHHIYTRAHEHTHHMHTHSPRLVGATVRRWLCSCAQQTTENQGDTILHFQIETKDASVLSASLETAPQDCCAVPFPPTAQGGLETCSMSNCTSSLQPSLDLASGSSCHQTGAGGPATPGLGPSPQAPSGARGGGAGGGGPYPGAEAARGLRALITRGCRGGPPPVAVG